MLVAPDEKVIISKALQALSGVCDGAFKQDTMGFNKFDSAFGKSLADQSLTGTLSDGQIVAAAKMLKKYKSQLEGFGITLPDALVKIASENKPEIWAEGGRIFVNFPRRPSEETLASIRMISGRNWNGQNWSFPVSSIEQLVKVVPEVSEITIQVEPEPAQSQSEPSQPASADVLLSLEDGYIVIRFGKGSTMFWDNLGIVKGFGERKYDPEKKLWKTPQRMASQLLGVLKGNVEMSPELKAVVQVHTELAKMSNQASSEFEVPNLRPGNELLPFQRAGVQFIEKALGNVVDISLCPLYNSNGSVQYAKRNLSETTKTIGASENQSSQRKGETSERQSSTDSAGTLQIRGMAYKGIGSDKDSHASAGNQSEASGSLERISGEFRKQFQGWEWSAADGDNRKVICPAFAAWLDKRISSPDQGTYNVPQCAFQLQSGFCSTQSKSSPGSGRPLSSKTNSESEGQKEAGSIREPWLDCPATKAQVNTTIQGALVGDSMGLGKTMQSIGYMALHPEKRPVLVVCPASLKLNWQREIKKWLATKETISIITGTGNQFAQVFGATVVIINYDVLGKWVDILTKCNFQLMVVDECHLVKNPKAQRSEAVKAMSKVIPQAVYLSGTPIVNRPVELFPVLNMIDPASWPKFTSYAYRYCAAGNNGWGWSANGASNLEELHELIKPFVIRRTKEQVLTELPPKRKASIIMQFDEKQRQAYWDALQAAMNSSKQAEQLRLIEVAKQAAVKGKLPAAIDWIENFIETEKLVVFCTHNFTVDTLMAKFGDKAVRLTGSENLKEREIAVDRFQNDDSVKLFVGNVIAAGTGITLTTASNVCFLEFAWTPGQMEQSADRVHRIGQTDSVTVWFLIADDTIEEKIVDLLNEKAKVLDIVHDGKEIEEHQINIMSELIQYIKEEKYDKIVLSK